MSDGHRRHAPRRRGATGPLVGWRVWRVAREAGCIRLRSAVFDDVWLPGHPVVARCEHGHAAPDRACACGVYAVSSPRPALRYLVGRDDADVVHRVVGEVVLWGMTIEGERGWRAERARPLRLWIPPLAPTRVADLDADAIAAALRSYDVPVSPLERHIPGIVPAELRAA